MDEDPACMAVPGQEAPSRSLFQEGKAGPRRRNAEGVQLQPCCPWARVTLLEWEQSPGPACCPASHLLLWPSGRPAPFLHKLPSQGSF